MMRSHNFLPLLALLLAIPTQAQISGGPMLGPISQREATIWVQTETYAEVKIVYSVTAVGDGENVPRAIPITTPTQYASDDNDNIALFRLTNLEPGWTYSYDVRVNGARVDIDRPLEFTTQPLWQYRTDPPTFTAALGSCNYIPDTPYDRPGDPYGGNHEIFDAIADMDPDLMLWIGDNVYYREVDWWSPEGLSYRQRQNRAFPQMQRLLSTAPNYATWDDHDFGPNNSDRGYILKGAALDIFQRYWPSTAYGLPDTPGVFSHFQFADVEFFMLDNRYNRTPNNAPADSEDDTILGEAQLQWLLDALQASYAPFKVIVSGGQVLNPNEVFETYANVAPDERQYLLDEIERRNIWGVMFLSGDRHHTELNRMDRDGVYPLYEFTSSPLTSGAATNIRDAENEYRVDGTLVTGQRNFGTITVEGERTDRVMTLRTFDSAGELLWEHQIRANDLRPPRD